MLKRLVVGLDGSALAEVSLPYAETLARAGNAAVTLMRVVSEDEHHPVQEVNPSLLPYMVAYPTTDPQAESTAQRAARHQPEVYLDAIADRLSQRGIVAEAAVVKGRPDDLLVAEAKARHADLLIVASHGRSGLGRWVFGSVTEAVLAQSPIPVLVVRAWSPPRPLVPDRGPARILVPLDGSPLAERALPLAGELARLLDARLHLVQMVALPHVAPTLEEAVVEEFNPALREELQRRADAYLTMAAQRLRSVGVNVVTEVRFGGPASGILAIADEQEAGLIVMATHGRTGLTRAFLGSVALEVLHRGDLPVLLVRNAPLEGV